MRRETTATTIRQQNELTYKNVVVFFFVIYSLFRVNLQSDNIGKNISFVVRG